MRKQIRNLNKKLDAIAELQTKIKKEKFVPNDAQKDKISQKESTLAKIVEINEYLKAYDEEKLVAAKMARDAEKTKNKEVRQARDSAVKQIGEMLILATIGAETQWKDFPEELQGGLKQVTSNIQGILGRTKNGSKKLSSLDWKEESFKFAKDFSRLANKSRDPAFGQKNQLTYEELVNKSNEHLGQLGDIIEFTKPVVKAPVAEPAPAKVEEETKQSEPAAEDDSKKSANPDRKKSARKPKDQDATAKPDSPTEEGDKPKREKRERKPRTPKAADATDEVKETKVIAATPEPKEEEPAKADVKATVEESKKVEHKSAPVTAEADASPEDDKKDDGEKLKAGRVRGERTGRGRGTVDGERGGYERGGRGRGDRGEYRGRGRGDRPRGEYRGRGRGGFRGRDGEDEDGFIEVRATGDKPRGRGRGRGTRGEFRGRDGERGRGEYRGRGGERGDRGAPLKEVGTAGPKEQKAQEPKAEAAAPV